MDGITTALVLDGVYLGTMCVMVTADIRPLPVVMDLMRTSPSASHGMYVTIITATIIQTYCMNHSSKTCVSVVIVCNTDVMCVQQGV